ncbi:dihydroxy-acid dehydratase [Streptomyces sp. NPDC051018]|uniref:bifunctional 4-hydroxy-2-oxoglutarate aldolase/2-dehydro-3-deoxy-phosphogluconate aldolase n=1 Tax=Streptomyces sp. NPDC051018 TaxID=3365639 RepID=UPI0037B1DE39
MVGPRRETPYADVGAEEGPGSGLGAGVESHGGGGDVEPVEVRATEGAGGDVPRGYPGMPEVGNLPMPRRLLEQGVTDMVRISDARISGTAYVTCVLHVAPEAAVGDTVYRWEHLELIACQKVVGIVRTDSSAKAVEMARACLVAGLRVVEISLTTPGALDAVRQITGERDDVLIGAGTVLDEASARAAVLAGARLLLSPSLHPEVISCGHRYGASVMPGVDTPAEAVAAISAGADAVKLFPASRWTPESFLGMRAALPQIPFVATGGISPEAAPEWIAAGAVAVGMGASLTAGTAAEAAARVADLDAALNG